MLGAVMERRRLTTPLCVWWAGAQGLGLVKSRMKPTDKLDWIRAQQKKACSGHVWCYCFHCRKSSTLVAMVGDGINDG